MKAVTSLSGPYDDVMLPKASTHGDWEVELGMIIGKTCRYVAEADALDHVAGYVLVNEVSERFNQKERGSQSKSGEQGTRPDLRQQGGGGKSAEHEQDQRSAVLGALKQRAISCSRPS